MGKMGRDERKGREKREEGEAERGKGGWRGRARSQGR